MQTFLPYSSFHKSAATLDFRRLGKQRVEAKQILETLRGQSNGWKNHPAVKMWYGYEEALAVYGAIMCQEWINRGFRDSLKAYFFARMSTSVTTALPPWLGDERLHSSHRANLLRKAPEHYSQFGWTEKPAEGYWWPTSKQAKETAAASESPT